MIADASMSDGTLHATRPTIGLLTAIVNQPFWLGVVDAARRHGVNLICFLSGTLPVRSQALLRVPYLQVLPALSFFALANSERLDGLITWGGSRSGFGINLDDAEMEEFIAPFRRLPMVNYEGLIQGVPSVVTDTRQGMRTLLEHLIERHQRCRIAFIRGPQRHMESEERFAAYQETLRAFGIPFDSALVYHDLRWGKIVGIEAARELISKRRLRPGADFDALVGSEIEYALGALHTLQESGVRVPDEVAVVGFNDHLDAQTLDLPITVVAKPFYESGVVAVGALLDRIAGKSIPDRIHVPARLIVRRSCGCWSPDRSAPVLSGDLVEARGDRLVAQIGRLRDTIDADIDRSWINVLIEGLLPGMPDRHDQERDQFWSAFERELSRRRTRQELAQWHDVISELFYLIVSALDHADDMPRANLLFLQRIRLALAQERERSRIELRTRTIEQSHTLLEISQSMLIAQDLKYLLEVLAQRLPELPVRDGYLVLYDDFPPTTNLEAPVWGRVVLALHEGRRLPLPPDGISFPSRRIVPDALLCEHQPYAFIVTPLFFGLRDFGFIAVQVGPREGGVYHMLAQEISSALQSVFLWRDYRRSEYARRESEARLHTIVEHMPVALWAKDLNGRYIMQNSVMRTLTGDNSWKDEDSGGAALAEWAPYEAWAREGRTVSFEHALLVQDQPRLFKHIIAPVQVDGTVTAILGLMFDITEQRTLEDSLRSAKESAEEARRAAEAANRAKSVFLSNISHELRTPLNSILGYAQILEHDPTTSDYARKSLRVIQSSGEQLLNLIDDLLDLAKIEAGKIEVRPDRFALDAMLATICDMMQERAVARNLAFAREIANLPRLVVGDEKRLWQVLVNLLSNAIKFTREGVVTLKVERLPDNRDKVRFEVIDTGIGIAPEYREVIFRPFEQLGAQTGEKGTGLGLAIARELVTLMGGTLRVQSAPGAGSRFWFAIPLPEAPAEPLLPKRASRRVIGVAGPAPKVLIVDDHPDNCAILRDMLQPLGIITAEAQDGYDGLERMAVFNPDAIVLDLVMPRLNGIDMIRRIRASAAGDRIVLIVSSASAYPDDRIQSLNAGAQAFIPKPIDRTILLETLQRHLPWVEWRYAEPSVDQSHWAAPVLLPRTMLDSLEELARIGDIDAIQQRVDALIQEMPQAASFVAQVRYFLEHFQIGQLQEFLKKSRAEG
ncbi:PAS/PAC sensor hybrid histidine kinase [Roseiflexus castenholzii DSM 13941]|jgi:signal transduction histidine kinase/DNA-binding LacI/PurR family transcriptional regulator/CheY-like chemotaxis protein|uniref:Circadian input-output histidine kinase CikA n=2 Tax=Roseiflexus castenholzii TaxID=120962 RepID=A7NF99_ROSCS|nr:PAS/PAC sensor hybrid histidine kinase [Roseiflexus castenholzii DSM 13941]